MKVHSLKTFSQNAKGEADTIKHRHFHYHKYVKYV